MRITVRIEQSPQTAHVYDFNLFDLTLVFVGYSEEQKAIGKRKWSRIKFWDNYDQRHSTIKEAPELPLTVRQMAFEQVMKMITVMRWEQWKK